MPEWAIQLAGYLVGAAAVYAGIRADLAAIRVKADQAVTSAGEAHRRIDGLLIQGRGNG